MCCVVSTAVWVCWTERTGLGLGSSKQLDGYSSCLEGKCLLLHACNVIAGTEDSRAAKCKPTDGDGICCGALLGSQVPSHGGALPNPTQGGASPEQDARWSRSSEREAGWSGQHSSLPPQWSMEVLRRVCSRPVESAVVIRVNSGSDVCTANHGDVKAGVTLALAFPLLAEHTSGNPPAQTAHKQWYSSRQRFLIWTLHIFSYLM